MVINGNNYLLEDVYVPSAMTPRILRPRGAPPPAFQPLDYNVALPDGTLKPSDDFAFLSLNGEQDTVYPFTAFPFIYPVIHPPNVAGKCLTVGYPGKLRKDDFEKLYPGVDYDAAELTFSGFQKKVLSIGNHWRISQFPPPLCPCD